MGQCAAASGATKTLIVVVKNIIPQSSTTVLHSYELAWMIRTSKVFCGVVMCPSAVRQCSPGAHRRSNSLPGWLQTGRGGLASYRWLAPWRPPISVSSRSPRRRALVGACGLFLHELVATPCASRHFPAPVDVTVWFSCCYDRGPLVCGCQRVMTLRILPVVFLWYYCMANSWYLMD